MKKSIKIEIYLFTVSDGVKLENLEKQVLIQIKDIWDRRGKCFRDNNSQVFRWMKNKARWTGSVATALSLIPKVLRYELNLLLKPLIIFRTCCQCVRQFIFSNLYLSGSNTVYFSAKHPKIGVIDYPVNSYSCFSIFPLSFFGESI